MQCDFHRKFKSREGQNRLVHKSENRDAVTNNKGVVSGNSENEQNCTC